jgi:uncharacterized membrane protein
MSAILLIAGVVAFLYLQGRLKNLELRLRLLEAGEPVAVAPGVGAIPEPPPVPPTPEPPIAAPPVEPEPVSAVEPAPEIVPVEELEEVEPALERQARAPRVSFEDLFGRKLPIWAGGVTLAIAGFLIVKYSIDTGLLSPAIRVMFGMLFGLGLIGGGECARRQQERVHDPRVAQALVGAGIATLYGSILIASNVYALVGPGTAFVGLAAVTAVALALASLFGEPSALLGLVGGFAAPLFVGSDEPNVPLLTIYLGLTIGGLAAVARRQSWGWLGYAAMAGGFLWSAVLIATSPSSASTSVSLLLLLLLVGFALPMQAGKGGPARAAIGAAVAALQVAAMVARGGFAPLDWGLFGLLSAALQWLAWRDPALRPMRSLGFAIALLLLAAWPTPPERDFGLALAAMLLIYGGPALFDLWRRRGGLNEAGQICAAAIAIWLLPYGQFYLTAADQSFGLLAIVGSALAACAAGLEWRNEARGTDLRFPLLVGASAISATAAAAFLMPQWLFAPALGAIACAVLAIALLGQDRRVEGIAWAGLLGTLGCLLFLPVHWTALEHAVGFVDVAGWPAIASLSLGFGATAVFARFGSIGLLRMVAQATAALIGYTVLGQFIRADFEPVLAAGMLAVLAVAGKRLLPALAALAGVALLWALNPFAFWFAAALRSTVAIPLLATDLPPVRDALLRLALPGAAIGAAGWVAMRDRRLPLAIGGTLLLVALHIGYKQLFAIGDGGAFQALGFAERTLWQGLLIAGGVAALRRARVTGLVLLGAGLAHFGWYSLLLHNPLWWQQAVGPLPLLNLLVPAYGLPLLALWLVGRELPRLEQGVRIVRMGLILLFGWSLLRQGFHGSFLVDSGLSQAEDIARSILLVGAGVGYLLWGIARGGRDWRVAALVLVLIAAGKVFLFDASGLDGLSRIGSFVALGFSLIGIGWLYARFVGKAGLTAPA